MPSSGHKTQGIAGVSGGGAKAPRWVWLVAVAAAVLSGVAFVLWGTNGAAYIVDMIAAYCL